MTLLTQIKDDCLAARKARDGLKSALLITLIGESEAIGKNDGNRGVTETEVISRIKKFINGIDETIRVMKDVSNNDGSVDRYVNALKEKSILEHYLPKQLTPDELNAAIQEIINDMKSCTQSPIKMGMVIGALKLVFDGQYDGKIAAEAIKAALA